MSSDFANHLQTAYEGLEDESIQITEEIAEFEEYVMGAKSYVSSIINKQKHVNANIKVRKRVNNWLSRNI